MIRSLAKAVRSGITSVDNWDHKLGALQNAFGFDVFDEVLFEIVTAASYLRNPESRRVSFTRERSNIVPDILVSKVNGEMLVECKKFNRQTNFSIKLREDVRNCLNKVIRGTLPLGRANLGEVVFYTDPKHVPQEQILGDYLSALQRGVEFERDEYQIRGRYLESSEDIDYVLYNSPKYYSERYGFDGEEWIGVVALVNGRPCVHVDFDDPESKASSWMDSVSWESAIKWTIADSEMDWRLKKMNYTSVFQGLKQVQSDPMNSQIHFWIERDPAIGHRKKEIIHLINSVGESALPFGWIIFNETISKVLLDGRFDFWEHAHPVGKKGGPTNPYVTTVFTSDEDMISNDGVFGIG